ncbi:DUF29 domain-containing protein [Caulobacter sp. S45]|uniref:DUF29 domain-containing protein n=1 Tax=Caulobacter sp. S45 TaxID=1641861 RepID=UPI001576F5BE|nr:DUF29 domain-containing protein [Caulobacter sp. S45]
MADDLYEQDFYLWTQAQAEALRARGVSNQVDWDTVAEEVEDMGKRELRAAESLLVRIIEHLHKLRTTKYDDPRLHWRKEIVAFRAQLEQRLTPSIRAKLHFDLERLHERGAKEAERWMFHDDIDFHPLDRTRRWTLPELLGEQDDPLPMLWNDKVQA